MAISSVGACWWRSYRIWCEHDLTVLMLKIFKCSNRVFHLISKLQSECKAVCCELTTVAFKGLKLFFLFWSWFVFFSWTKSTRRHRVRSYFADSTLTSNHLCDPQTTPPYTIYTISPNKTHYKPWDIMYFMAHATIHPPPLERVQRCHHLAPTVRCL